MRRAHLWLVALAAIVPRVIVLVHERDKILTAFTDKSDDFALTFVHHGTFGLVPGQPSNRNLADFSSAAIDPSNGCGALAVPADPYNRPDQADGANNGDSSAFMVSDSHANSCSSLFIVDTENGTIDGWSPGVNPNGTNPSTVTEVARVGSAR